MAKIIKSPDPLVKGFSVFLAGSIELGNAINWQSVIEKELNDLDIIILNPRREYWNPEWSQNADNPKFREQVEWELEALEHSDVIAMYLDPNTKSPISLLELGLFAHTEKLLVCCPKGFWRKGNVDIVCEKYDVKQVESLDELITCIMEKYRQTHRLDV